ncbi:MAG: NUDIX hydrolase [Salinivirgaceae bacterium]|jgi:ADP-ribose pyrophosphatase YjhB (NUDIX family)|nr:NUDIX hydrolase [Salinivirgaceae bacterium]
MTNIKQEGNDILNIAKRLKSMAEVGLMYAEIGYDIDRYKELKEISFELMQQITDQPIEDIKGAFKEPLEYPTPNVDVRGVVINEKQQILLVKEASDGKWTLPGGWCEIGVTPKENIVKEMKEETGLDVEVDRLIALFDKRCHPHPPQSHYVYKLVFECKVIGSPEFKPDYEITDIGYFDIDELPELSKDRILENQLLIVYTKLLSGDVEVWVD